MCTCDGLTYFGKRFERARSGDVLSFDEMLKHRFVMKEQEERVFPCTVSSFPEDPVPRHQKQCWCVAGVSTRPPTQPKNFEYFQIPGAIANYTQCRIEADPVRRNVEGVEACEKACNAESGCDSFNYEVGFRTCFLLKPIGKDGCEMVKAIGDSVLFFTKKTRSYEPFPGIKGDFAQCQVGGHVVTRSLVDCANECDLTANCYSFTFDKTNGRCELLRSPADPLCTITVNNNTNVEYHINLKDISTFAPTNQPIVTASPTPPKIVPTVRPTTAPPTFRPTRSVNIQRSLFTSASTGVDSPDCGIVEVPCKSIGHALNRIVAAAAPSEVNLEVLLADGVYAGVGNINVEIQDSWAKNIDIRGIGNVEIRGGDAPFFLRQANAHKTYLENVVITGFQQAVLVSKPDTQLELISTTVTNCSGGSGAAVQVSEEAVLVVRDSELSHNTAQELGGAIMASEKATVSVLYSQLSHNLARGSGGAIAAVGGSHVILTRATVSSNSALFGGAVYASAGSSLDASDSTVFKSNSATFAGGGVFAIESRVNAGTSTFSGHVAGGDGGAIYLRCVGSAEKSTLQDTEMKQSVSERRGGHVFVRACPLEIIGGTLEGGSAAEGGGGVAADAAEITLDDSQLRRNSAGGYGGGLHAVSSVVVVRKCRFEENRAAGDGGGLFATTDVDVSADEDSAFVDNVATGGGGGAFAQSLKAAGFLQRKLTGFNLAASFQGNTAAYGPDQASSATKLCVGYRQATEVLCGMLNESPEATTNLNQALLRPSTSYSCSAGSPMPAVNASTDSGLPLGIFLFEQDSFGNNYTAAGAEIAISLLTNSSDPSASIHGRQVIFTGTGAASCLDKTAVRGRPGTISRIAFFKRDSDVGVELPLRLQPCSASDGQLMNTTDFSCRTCPTGFFAADSGACEQCPDQGALCSSGKVYLDGGWWAPAESTPEKAALGMLVRCPEANTCAGRFSSSLRENACVPGRTGVLCAACQDGSVPMGQSRECVECTDSSVLGVVAGLVLLFNLTLVYGCSVRRNAFIVSVFKVLLTHLQILGLAIFVRAPWAEYLNYFFVYSSALSLSGLSYLDCLLSGVRIDGSTYIVESILALLIPLLLMVILGLLVLLRQVVHLRTLRPTADGLAFFCSSLIVLYLAVQMLLARAGVEYFACFGAIEAIFGSGSTPDELRFLIADPHLLCSDNDTYTAWAYGFGLVVLLFLGCVAPWVILAVALRSFRHKARGRLRMLSFTYEADVYFWDLVVFVRNIIVLCCAVLLQFENGLQVLGILIVLSLSALIQLNVQPFQDEEANAMAMGSLLVLILTFTSALLLDGAPGAQQESAVNGLVFALNIGFLCYALLSSTCHRFQWLVDKIPLKRGGEGVQGQKGEASRHPENDYAQPGQTTDYHALNDGTSLANHVGMRVRLVQLRERPELNGTEAVLVAYSDSTGLCDVVSRNNQRFKVSRYNVELAGGNQQPAMGVGTDATNGGEHEKNALELLDQEIAAAEKKVKELEEENAKLKREAKYLGGLKQVLVDNDES